MGLSPFSFSAHAQAPADMRTRARSRQCIRFTYNVCNFVSAQEMQKKEVCVEFKRARAMVFARLSLQIYAAFSKLDACETPFESTELIKKISLRQPLIINHACLIFSARSLSFIIRSTANESWRDKKNTHY